MHMLSYTAETVFLEPSTYMPHRMQAASTTRPIHQLSPLEVAQMDWGFTWVTWLPDVQGSTSSAIVAQHVPGIV